jgi:2-polyprenyl-3-methyl-5-hydroxy-6-metoxy-1,4-benzoquinol methylase
VQLRTRATDDELALLRAALAWIVREAEPAFDLLFDPTTRPSVRRALAPPPAPILGPLVAFGLVEETPAGVRGTKRIRRVAGRFYVLELGLGDEHEYFQDLWPESDALLAALDGLPTGRVLEVGSGSGVIAVEAAARGHAVVATDVFDTALVLARFNARLNGVAVDFRLGHLFEPVAGERFSLIVTNPHYGRLEDQLRVEVLRDAPAHLADGGRLRLATMLEWDEAGARLGIASILEDLARRFSVSVRPIAATRKRGWFHRAKGAAGVVSRDRFTVDIAAGNGLSVELPSSPPRDYVPVERLTQGAVATVGGAELGRLLDDLAAGRVELSAIPASVLDACRFGAAACVADRGAARAIAGDAGVRPCSHGGVVAPLSSSVEEIRARLTALAAEAAARRGCASCAAATVCSRCLFPLSDENAYCDFIRAHAAALPRWPMLLAGIEYLFDGGATGPLVAIAEGDKLRIRAGDQVVEVTAELRCTPVEGRI